MRTHVFQFSLPVFIFLECFHTVAIPVHKMQCGIQETCQM